MTEGDFLKDWVNDVTNEFDEKAHHEYSEIEVWDMLRKWKELKEQELKQKIEDDFKKWQEQIKEVIVSEFKPKDVGIGVIHCISCTEQIESLAVKIINLHK